MLPAQEHFVGAVEEPGVEIGVANAEQRSYARIGADDRRGGCSAGTVLTSEETTQSKSEIDGIRVVFESNFTYNLEILAADLELIPRSGPPTDLATSSGPPLQFSLLLNLPNLSLRTNNGLHLTLGLHLELEHLQHTKISVQLTGLLLKLKDKSIFRSKKATFLAN